jgi:hypothetical protein
MVLAALLLLAGGAIPAAAQTDACIPAASGVPALSGPPNWVDPPLPVGSGWPRPDDPRWRGAFVHLPMPGAAATEHVTFRALRTATSLYLIWYVTVDPLLDDNDQLWVAFSPGGGAQDMLINVVPFNASGTDVPPVADTALPAPFAVSVSTRVPGNPFAGAALPDWLDPATTHMRVFRKTANNSWAVLMEVPVSADPEIGLNLPPAFSMWFEVQVTHALSNMVPYRFPAALTFDQVLVSTDATGFKQMQRTVAPTDAVCMKGISLAVSDIGIVPDVASCANVAVSTSGTIKLTQAPGNPALPGINVLCARPRNDTSDPVAAGDLDATFRTANWGTQPEWNSVPDPLNTLWQTINTTPVTGALIPASPAKGALSFTWNLTVNDGTVNDACRFDPQPPGIGCGALPANSRKRHQCTLVELGGAPGKTLTTGAVYRNMDFVNASTFTREAEVSVVGLAARPAPEPQRDVYLYVQTNNMPAEVPDGGIPEGEDPQDPRGRRRTGLAAKDGGQEIPPLEQGEYANIRDREPTYQIHAFHETGRTSTVRGKTYTLLEPQTSFGYFVEHQGPLAGWSHELQGAQLVAPDYYLIAVPENGTGQVTTVIEAIEPRHWSLSLHAGVNAPQGDFGNACDGGFSLGLDLEYRFNKRFAAELFFGREDFDCGGIDSDLNHLSANAKTYFGSGQWRPFSGAGIGVYDFSPGPSKVGFNVFAGLQANPSARVGVEGTVHYHFVPTDGADSNFLTAQLGLRIRF